MKTLQAFWHWVENESPATYVAWKKAQHILSAVALEALTDAADTIGAHGSGESSDWPYEDIAWCVSNGHMGPLRDLSLDLCAAYERMRAQVPEHVETWSQKLDRIFIGADFGHNCPPDVRAMVEPPRHIIGPSVYESLAREWGVIDWVKSVEPDPGAAITPTPQADGTHALDVPCTCGRFIVKSGGIHAHQEPDGTRTDHSQFRCMG